MFNKEIYKFTTQNKIPYIIDCGANIGLSAIYFHRLYPQAEILAFEPDPAIFDILEKNVSAANASDKIKRVQACLSDTNGEVNFYPDGADGGTISHADDTVQAVKVPAVLLSDYLTKPVDFLKIDIEGAEYDVLNSISNKLNMIENIFVEYHSFVQQPQQFGEILIILKNAGFRYYIEHVGIRSDEPYLHRNEDHGMDMQINIYGYRA